MRTNQNGLFSIKAQDLEVELTPFGATLTAIRFPDRNGNSGNLVLSYTSIDKYHRDPFYLGSVVGRFAGRISGSLYSATHYL